MNGPLRPPGGTTPLLRALCLVCAACLFSVGCAAKKEEAGPGAGGSPYASADEANVAAFLEQYIQAWNGDDEKRVLRLYADEAKLAPLMVQDRRTVGKKELAGHLTHMLKTRARMGLRIALDGPPEINVKGESAEARAMVRAAFVLDGKPKTATLEYRFNLKRIDFFWKITLERYQGATTPPARPAQGGAVQGGATRTKAAPAGKGGPAKTGKTSEKTTTTGTKAKGGTSRTPSAAPAAAGTADQPTGTDQPAASPAPSTPPAPSEPSGKPRPLIPLN